MATPQNPFMVAQMALLAATDPESFADLASRSGFRPSQLKVPGIKLSMDMSKEKPVKTQDLRTSPESEFLGKGHLGKPESAGKVDTLIEDAESTIQSWLTNPDVPLVGASMTPGDWPGPGPKMELPPGMPNWLIPGMGPAQLPGMGGGGVQSALPFTSPMIPPAGMPQASPWPIPARNVQGTLPPPFMGAGGRGTGMPPVVPPQPGEAPLVQFPPTENIQNTLPPPFMGGEFGRGTGMPLPVPPVPVTGPPPVLAGAGGPPQGVPSPMGTPRGGIGLGTTGPVPPDAPFTQAAPTSTPVTGDGDTGAGLFETITDWFTKPRMGPDLSGQVTSIPQRGTGEMVPSGVLSAIAGGSPAVTPVPIEAREPAQPPVKTIATQPVETATATKPRPANNMMSTSAIDKAVADATGGTTTATGGAGTAAKLAAASKLLSGVRASAGGGGAERMPPSGGVHFGPIQQGQMLELLMGRMPQFAPALAPFAKMF